MFWHTIARMVCFRNVIVIVNILANHTKTLGSQICTPCVIKQRFCLPTPFPSCFVDKILATGLCNLLLDRAALAVCFSGYGYHWHLFLPLIFFETMP